jgi:hypothetical protein
MTMSYEDLRRDGFTVAKKLLPPNVIAAARDSISRTLADQLSQLNLDVPADLHSQLRALYAADLDRYKQTLAALWRKADIAAVMRHEALFDFVRSILGWGDVFLPGGEVVILMASDLKIPDGYFGLKAHQDFPSVQGSLDGLVVWIPLLDVDADNFPLQVVPGSHRLGLVTDIEQTRNGWEIINTQLDRMTFQPIPVEAGDAVFMSVFTIHRSGLDGSGLRIALSTRFDNAVEPSFIARGYPTAYQRIVHREQFVPGFPDASDMATLWP